MIPGKKKMSLWFVLLGAILSGYVGYLLNGAWEPGCVVYEFLERFEFYERAKKAYAVVYTGESALYANIIIKKGVL